MAGCFHYTGTLLPNPNSAFATEVSDEDTSVAEAEQKEATQHV